MMAISTGPSIRAVCRIINQNSCGSGSICGIQNGRSLILTNAHVAGTSIGRIVSVEVESTGDKINARVIMAAYSDRTTADWAILETVEPYSKVEPVKLSKKRPTGSHYTKGFPRCRAMEPGDITTVSFKPPVWFWEPDAIGGQSGSGVWSDDDGFQYGLLTWQWGSHGAGQMTADIYTQARAQNTVGWAKPDGLIPLTDYDFSGLERGKDDPVVEPGFFSQTGIQDLPIWAEDEPTPPIDPDDPNPSAWRDYMIEYHRRLSEFHDRERTMLEGVNDTNDNGPGLPGLDF